MPKFSDFVNFFFRDFYTRLFEVNPAGKRLFESTGLKAQGRALVSMIGMIVRCIDDFSAFSSHIRELGGRHRIYGVHEVDYATFSETLAGTISALLSDDSSFPPGVVEAAWMKALTALSKMMVAASRSVRYLLLIRQHILKFSDCLRTLCCCGVKENYGERKF